MQNRLAARETIAEGGFTLIEILVVVLIIGITLGFALLAFGDFGNSRRVMVAAEQFVNYVKFVQQQAILESSTLGIKITNNSYQVLRLQPSSTWLAISGHAVFKPQFFPAHAQVYFEQVQAKTNTNTNTNTPQIIINASGDVQAFTLHFGSDKQANIANVIETPHESIHLKRFTSS